MRIVSQGACPSPKCNSSDAYTEYDDGHGWCFSCRYYKPAKITSAKQVANILSEKSQGGTVLLPDDFTYDIPKEPLTWLKKYGLTQEEIEKNNYGWSQQRELLIFPFYENKTLVLWTGKYFPTRVPKVFHQGGTAETLVRVHCPLDSRSAVIVEDVVSAIKVSRILPSIALLGTNLSLPRIRKLSSEVDTLYIWLDGDKYREGIAFKERYKCLFKNVFVIFTNLDPKEYSTRQIEEHLSGNGDFK